MNQDHLGVCCFGEVLWDKLPDGDRPGGAPMNVAYHLNKLGIRSDIITRIGRDEEGEKLKNLMEGWGFGQNLLQEDPRQKTSQVIATVDERGDVSYNIVFPVAWDYLDCTPESKAAVAQAQYFVFGSLAARNQVSRETLWTLLDSAQTKVLDINLRAPFYERELLAQLMIQADILKINDEELSVVSKLFSIDQPSEVDRVHHLQIDFNLPEVVVTKGAAGASYYVQSEIFSSSSPQVKVVDTVGSGDSFLAAFLASHLQGEQPNMIVHQATAMGAFIATRSGGCPDYEQSEYRNFLKAL